MLVEWGERFVKGISTKIVYAQDALMEELIEELRVQAEDLQFSDGSESLKFKISLEYGWEGCSTLGTAFLSLASVGNRKCDIAYAFFGEKWVEQDNVRLVKGCWPDW